MKRVMGFVSSSLLLVWVCLAITCVLSWSFYNMELINEPIADVINYVIGMLATVVAFIQFLIFKERGNESDRD